MDSNPGPLVSESTALPQTTALKLAKNVIIFFGEKRSCRKGGNFCLKSFFRICQLSTSSSICQYRHGWNDLGLTHRGTSKQIEILAEHRDNSKQIEIIANK